MVRGSGRVVAGAVGFAVAVSLVTSSGRVAAFPDPSPPNEPTASVEPTSDGGVALEAWLDAPLRLDAPVGSMIHLGAFAWIPGADEPVRGATFEVWLWPASGSAEPTFGYASEDFAGHLVADIEVPAGGVGRLEIGLPGTVCQNDVCEPQLTSVPIRGVGPPPGVSLTVLATALISPPIAAIVAGRAATFQLTLQPVVQWAPPGLILPETLWLQVRAPQGPSLDEVAATLVDQAAGRYEAAVTFGQAGDYVLEAGTVAGAERAQLFGSSVRRVTVEAEATSAPGSGGADAAGSKATPGWLVIGSIAVLIVGLGLVVLGRRRV